MRPARFAAVLVCAAIAGGSGCSEPALEADESAVVCPADDPDCDRIDEPCVMDEKPAADLEPGSSPTGLGGPLTGGGKHQIWPKGRVPYKVGSTVNGTTKSRLLSAMKEWETKTKGVVRFEAATSADKAHVLVSEGSPRVAFVGYRAGTVVVAGSGRSDRALAIGAAPPLLTHSGSVPSTLGTAAFMRSAKTSAG